MESKKAPYGGIEKIFIEKMNSSKQCDLEELAHNTVDVDTKADSDTESKKAPYWGIEKIVKYHVRHIDETNLHSKMCLL